MFLRSFAVQATFNYRTLIANGFAFALLPALREIFHGRPAEFDAALERHTRVFNSHPYFTGIALGAVAVLEAQGAEPQVIERFKSAVRGSLGSLGDRLIWAGWRPACLLVALLLFFVGVPWWGVLGTFLLTYNIGHFFVRAWGFRIGLRHATAVAEQLRRPGLRDAQRGLASACAFLLGAVLPFVAAGKPLAAGIPPIWLLAVAAASVLGLRFGAAIRTPAVLVLAGFVIVGLVWGAVR